jgi:hypothetical protein
MKAPANRRSSEPFAQSGGTPLERRLRAHLQRHWALADAALSRIAISSSGLRQKTCLLIYSAPIFQEPATIQGLDGKSDAQ